MALSAKLATTKTHCANYYKAGVLVKTNSAKTRDSLEPRAKEHLLQKTYDADKVDIVRRSTGKVLATYVLDSTGTRVVRDVSATPPEAKSGDAGCELMKVEPILVWQVIRKNLAAGEAEVVGVLERHTNVFDGEKTYVYNFTFTGEHKVAGVFTGPLKEVSEKVNALITERK